MRLVTASLVLQGQVERLVGVLLGLLAASREEVLIQTVRA